MKKAYKQLYLEAIKEIEAIKGAEASIDASNEQRRMLDESVSRLNTIASNNLKLRGELARHRVISFMLTMGLLVQYCLFKFY